MLKLEYYIQKFRALPFQGSADWLEGRLFSFGGSEMASVLGKNPYESWEKLKENKSLRASVHNDATEWGHLFEPVAKQFVKKAWGEIYEFGSIPHSQYPVCYSPDGLMVLENELVLLEIKTPIQRGIKKIAEAYYIQVQTGLGVIAAKYALFAQFRFRRCKWGTDPKNTVYDRFYHLEFRKRCIDMYPFAWGFFWWDVDVPLCDLASLKNMSTVMQKANVKPKLYVDTYPTEMIDHGYVLMWKCFEQCYSSIKKEKDFLYNKEEMLWKKYEELRQSIHQTL